MRKLCYTILMHRKYFFIAILLCGVFLQTALADTYEEREGRGLVILSEPSGAAVFINGIEKGHTPLSLPDIMPGSYMILLKRESYEDRQIAVTVPRRGQIIISLDMEKAMGTLVIDPKTAQDIPSWLPFDPEIYIDGVRRSEHTISLPVGFHNVLVRAFGFEDASAVIMIAQDRTRILELEMKNAVFRISDVSIRRMRFNPANSGSLGTTECMFEISGPGKGMFYVTNSQGIEVYSQTLEPFTTWPQSVAWNGRDKNGKIVPDGFYDILIDTESIPWDDNLPVIDNIIISYVEIDSSIQIFPETMASAKSGLLFAAGTDILPKGSYQLDALTLFGKPLTANEAWGSLPLAFSLRFSPLDFLEASLSLNVTPEFSSDTIIGAGGSVKWQILNRQNGGLPLGLAAVLSYGWAEEGPLTPFAMGTGLDISIPVSWSFGNSMSAFLTPGILWSGEKGYPDSGVPSGVLSAGISYRRSVFNSGLSVRTEYLFENGAELGPVSIGGEIKFFPLPSIFVISATAGIVYENNSWGGFGGIGIGFIQ